MNINLALFPLPYINRDKKFDGAIFSWAPKCLSCKVNSCHIPTSVSLMMCSSGFNYQRLTSEIIVGGFLIRDCNTFSPARKKNLREYKSLILSQDNLIKVTKSLSLYNEASQQEIEKEKQKILDKYVEAEEYKLDFLNSIKPKITEGLSYVHDYKQINAQIAQNINVIIESRYGGPDFETKFEQATQAEKSIYIGSKLLEEKLNVAKLLVNPEKINTSSEYKRFRFHGIVMKYRRIYTPYIINKAIDFQITGQSYNEIMAHPEAIGVIPHTLIDNAIKYSPKGGLIIVNCQDQNDGIDFSVASYGPRILPDEKNKIFTPFYRGIAAKKQEEEGAGYGLYISQVIAKQHLGTLIRYDQDSVQKPHYGHWTVFSVKIPLKAFVFP